MASLGHVAVGLAAARVAGAGGEPSWSSRVWWSALSLLPDLDVVGFAIGVEYADEWGHRGASHSLTLSLAFGVIVGVAARWSGLSSVRTALIATVVLASHGVLDTMTDGGLGCALWWPLDQARYFAPWRPIPVAPIGLAFFSRSGATIALIELVLFAPLLVFALRPRQATGSGRVRRLWLAFWVITVWLLASTDSIRERIVGFIVREDTAYAPGFTEAAFRSVTPGLSIEAVRDRLGSPVREDWLYSPAGGPFESAETRSATSLSSECLVLSFERERVVTAFDRDACARRGIVAEVTAGSAERVLGTPPERCWHYTWRPEQKSHRIRLICFARGQVQAVFRQWNFSAR